MSFKTAYIPLSTSDNLYFTWLAWIQTFAAKAEVVVTGQAIGTSAMSLIMFVQVHLYPVQRGLNIKWQAVELEVFSAIKTFQQLLFEIVFYDLY